MSTEATAGDLPTLHSIGDVVALLCDRSNVFVRWSRGPAFDQQTTSSDDLTGVPLEGLSANPLAVEEWWQGRSLELWVARRLYDYRHLPELRGPQVRPWLLAGREVGRGPDNEPLVVCEEPLAWLDAAVIEEAIRVVEQQRGEWGPLRRR